MDETRTYYLPLARVLCGQWWDNITGVYFNAVVINLLYTEVRCDKNMCTGIINGAYLLDYRLSMVDYHPRSCARQLGKQ